MDPSIEGLDHHLEGLARRHLPRAQMANGARAEGIEANLFFTFLASTPSTPSVHHIKVAAVGNPGMHMASLIGGLPGMSAIATRMMERKMAAFDIPDIPEFMEMIADTGCGLYACKASVDLFGFDRRRLHPSGQGHHHCRRVLRDRRRRRGCSSSRDGRRSQFVR